MNTRIVMVCILGTTISIPAAAQQTTFNERVAQAMPSKYTPPGCGIKPGHFKVSSGGTYLKTGVETIPANRARVLGSGQKVLTEAIEKNGQEKNPAAWY